MSKILHILLVLLFSLTISSCGSDDGGSSASTDSTSSTTNNTSDDDSTTDNYVTCDTITTNDNDTTSPTFVSSTPADYEHSVLITSNISVTFSETMDTSTVTDNTLDTVCYGTFQISSNIYETCVQLDNAPTGSNNDKTFTITPRNKLLNSTVYRVRLVSGIKDCAGNYFGGWNMASGFKTASLLEEVTAVATSTNDNTPDYTFLSSVAGTITYGGSCSSSTTSATTDNNTITFNSLSDGTYSNCTITITDNASNSVTLNMCSFVIDTNPVHSYVVVGSSGTILTSIDGTTWSSRTSGTSVPLYGVTYGNGLFVTVGWFGTILTSSDGITWTSRTSGTTHHLLKVKYLNSEYVIVGYETMLKSSNGTSWTSVTSPGANCCKSISYGNGVYIIPGRWSFYTSSLGSYTRSNCQDNWVEDENTFINSAHYIVGATNVLRYVCTSSDGSSWTKKDISDSDTPHDIIFQNNRFLVVGGSRSSSGGSIDTSTDYTNWTNISSCSNGSTFKELRGVTYGNNIFVSLGNSGNIVTSSNGTSWTCQTSGTSSTLYDVSYKE